MQAVMPASAWQRWATRVALAGAFALALAYVPYRLLGGSATAQVARLGGELERVRAASAELRAENAELRREIEALRSDPGAIEDIARDDLGLVRPGELVIRVDEVAK
jgi:cell division protein FtsB